MRCWVSLEFPLVFGQNEASEVFFLCTISFGFPFNPTYELPRIGGCEREGIAIALPVGFSIAFAIRSVDRSLDPYKCTKSSLNTQVN